MPQSKKKPCIHHKPCTTNGTFCTLTRVHMVRAAPIPGAKLTFASGEFLLKRKENTILPEVCLEPLQKGMDWAEAKCCRWDKGQGAGAHWVLIHLLRPRFWGIVSSPQNGIYGSYAVFEGYPTPLLPASCPAGFFTFFCMWHMPNGGVTFVIFTFSCMFLLGIQINFFC